MEEFKNLGVLFTSEGKMQRDINRRIGRASAVMWALLQSVVMKRTSSPPPIFTPTFTYSQEVVEVVTERTRSRVQVAEISFLRRVAGLSLRYRVRCFAI